MFLRARRRVRYHTRDFVIIAHARAPILYDVYFLQIRYGTNWSSNCNSYGQLISSTMQRNPRGAAKITNLYVSSRNQWQ